MISKVEMVMGTVFSFLVEPGDVSIEQVNSTIDRACTELHQLDDRFSRWKPNSELSRYRSQELKELSSLMDEVFELCAHACQISNGFFDPWSMPGGFDPTGLVKGWAAQRALSILAQDNFEDALINAGGDICVLANRPHEVGIQHPTEPGALCGVVVTNSAIATSGTYERGDHLLNPFGGEIAAISATVVGGDLATTDALATALAVGGKEVLFLLEKIDGVEGFFITKGGSMFKTSNMMFTEATSAVL